MRDKSLESPRSLSSHLLTPQDQRILHEPVDSQEKRGATELHRAAPFHLFIGEVSRQPLNHLPTGHMSG